MKTLETQEAVKRKLFSSRTSKYHAQKRKPNYGHIILTKYNYTIGMYYVGKYFKFRSL